MDKRFWVCGLVMSIAALLLACIIHRLLLAPAHATPGTLLHGGGLHWVVLASVLLGYAMTWIYAQGFSEGQGSPAQGLRFGLAMALFAVVPGALLRHAMQALPATATAKQVVFGTIAMLLLGLLVAWLQPRRKVLRELP